MAGSFLLPRFRAAVMAISPREVHSRFWKRNGPITQVYTARSSIPVGTLSWRTQTRTCRSRRAENLFPLRCTTSCDSLAPTECMPGICQAIQRPMAVFGCRNSTQLHSSMQSMLALQSRFTEERRPGATWGNRGRHSHGALVDLEVHVSTRDFSRLRHPGGSDKSQTSCARLKSG
jgi:hypothetical protein